MQAGSASPATSFGVSLLPMRILLWHGYLLGGTGSNVYSRALAREWSRGGHEVVVVSQERAPEQYDLGGAQAVAVDLPGRLLPVFVMDRYEGLEPKLLQDFSEAERRAYVEANAAALRALLPADLVFTNHVLMGGPVGAASGAPFRVKAHGSELEYSMRGRPELASGRGKLLRARTRPTLAPSTFAKCSQTWLAILTACSTFLPAWTSTGSFCRTVAQRSRTCSQRAARIHRTAATSACPTTATRSAWPRFSTGSGRSSFTSGS